jgi:hypothetical protein
MKNASAICAGIRRLPVTLGVWKIRKYQKGKSKLKSLIAVVVFAVLNRSSMATYFDSVDFRRGRLIDRHRPAPRPPKPPVLPPNPHAHLAACQLPTRLRATSCTHPQNGSPFPSASPRGPRHRRHLPHRQAPAAWASNPRIGCFRGIAWSRAPAASPGEHTCQPAPEQRIGLDHSPPSKREPIRSETSHLVRITNLYPVLIRQETTR